MIHRMPVAPTMRASKAAPTTLYVMDRYFIDDVADGNTQPEIAEVEKPRRIQAPMEPREKTGYAGTWDMGSLAKLTLLGPAPWT